MAKTDAAFVAKVIQPIILEILPLFFFFKILLSLEILIIAKRIGMCNNTIDNGSIY